MAQGFLDERRKKKKELEEKKKLTIEGERTPEERKEIRETKTIAERAAQFQEEKRRQEAADPLLTAPSSAIKGGTVELPDGRVFSGLSPQEVGEIQQQQGLQVGVGGTGLQGGVVGTPEQQQEAARVEALAVAEQTGFLGSSDALIAHLERQQADPLDLRPTPLGKALVGGVEGEGGLLQEGVSAIADPLFNKAGRDEFVSKLYAGNITGEDAVKLAKGELNAIKNQGKAAAVILTGVFASQSMGTKLMSLATKSKVAAHATKTAGVVKGIAGLAAVAFGLQKASDFNRGRIAQLDKQLGTLTSNSSTLLSEVKNGMSVVDGLEIAQIMSDEIDEIEAAFLLESKYNLTYRNSEEYVTKMKLVRDARANLNERVLGIRNIALTGQAAYDPLQAMLSINGLE